MTDPMSEASSRATPTTLPTSFLWTVVGLCAIPTLVRLAGFDFGVDPVPASTIPAGERELYERLQGAFLHTILEGTAVAVAFMTGGLAIAHHRLVGGIVAPVLALALLFGGVLDAFHILASDYLLIGRAPDRDFVPFSWAVARLFNATILMLGVVALVSASRRSRKPRPSRFVLSWAIAFGVLGLIVTIWVQQTTRLPTTMLSEGLITRPWDLPPLALYALAAILAIPMLHRTERSAFVQAVWLSMVPAIATQAHMAFRSAVLFDHDFNSAHLLKILAYAVPFIGLLLEYRSARSAELEAVSARSRAEVRRAETERRLAELRELTVELERSNRELEQFAYIASHDLRAPLRAVSNLTSWLEEDFADRLSDRGREFIDLIRNRVQRLERMISSLLEFSRVGRSQGEPESIDTGELIRNAIDLLDPPDEITVLVNANLPTVRVNRARLRQVLQNLISNAVRFAKSEIRVGAKEAGDHWEFWVSDDGPGIDPAYHDRIWGLFTRLEARDDVEGTGLGLALVQKIVQGWRGRAWIESTPGHGATFRFTIPVRAVEAEAAAGDLSDAAWPEPRVDPLSGPRRAVPSERTLSGEEEIQGLLAEGRAAIESFDPEWLRETLDRALGVVEPAALIEDVLAPLVQSVGDMWFHERIDVRHEHMASAAVRATLDRLITRLSSKGAGRPHLVAATPAGQRHELGLMLAVARATAEGWRATYLGPDLPLDDIAEAVLGLEADALALSLVYPGQDDVLSEGLTKLRDHLPASLPIIVGGRAVSGFDEALRAIGAIIQPELGRAGITFRTLAGGRLEPPPEPAVREGG